MDDPAVPPSQNAIPVRSQSGAEQGTQPAVTHGDEAALTPETQEFRPTRTASPSQLGETSSSTQRHWVEARQDGDSATNILPEDDGRTYFTSGRRQDTESEIGMSTSLASSSLAARRTSFAAQRANTKG